MKGTVQTPDGSLQFDYSTAGFCHVPADKPLVGGLAWICRGDIAESIQKRALSLVVQ